MSEVFTNLDLILRQNLFPKLGIAQTTHDLGLKTSIQNFDTFVRCTLMGNQPWPQFQNGIRERSIGKKSGTKSIRIDQIYDVTMFTCQIGDYSNGSSPLVTFQN